MSPSRRSRVLVSAPLGLLCVALGVAVPGAAPAAATTPARYTITDLGAFASGDYSAATAINNAGVVVGSSQVNSLSPHAFRWSGGVLTDLGVEPGGGASWANAINDAGQVAGTADRQSGGYGYPVRWSATGVLTDLGGSLVNRLGVGNGIDPAGRVVGGQRPANSEGSPIAILYDTAGNQTLLGNPPESLNAATAINARGQIVGGPAFVWQNGTLTYLPVLPGANSLSAAASAINISGVVVGSAGAADGSGLHAALWRGGVLTDLGLISGIVYNQATGINAAGQVIGTADPMCSPCTAPVPWIWQPGTALTPLSTLIPTGSGWTLQRASGINDRGQIVGVGVHNGHTRAFLLTPVYAATVNFGPAGSAVPAGYALDSGAVYGVRSGGASFGWNIDNAVNTRDRNMSSSPDQRYDTLTHMQRSGSATTWELAVPNGRYTVHVVVGDAQNNDSVYGIRAEATTVVSGTPTPGNRWFEGTALVTVSDGRLTVTNAAGSSNNKIDYIDVIAS